MQSDKRDQSIHGKFLEYRPEHISIEIASKGDAILVLTDQYYPGWQAFVDGVETSIYPADLLYRGIFLKKGKHFVEFVYRPWYILAGIWISGISFIITIIYLLISLFIRLRF